jgi:hypothetical protein
MKYAMDIISLGYAHLDSMSLELRPLSSITEEEAKEFCNYSGYEVFKHYFFYLTLRDFSTSTLLVGELIDWSRSKGFLLPFMGIPSEQWVEWGVVKLKTE